MGDMVEYLAKVLDNKGGEVTADERNLLSVAFKNLISSKRAACRTIAAIEQNPKYSKFAGAITTKVLAKECGNEAKAFFVKMIGDYYRYIAENAKDALLEDVKQKALQSYEQANGI